MSFIILLVTASIAAGGVACICGFGIGSLLTPLFAVKCTAAVAVAGVSVAHFIGTAWRFWKWKEYIDRKVLLSFGITSAAGGLLGALFHRVLQNDLLTVIFGCLLVFAGFMGMTGLSGRLRFNGIVAWVAGALSGIFGGLVGNQGGIRSAAMLGFDIKGKQFVATATGIALIVDVVRMPVYFLSHGQQMLSIWPLIAVSSVGVFIGTEIGIRVMNSIPDAQFKRVVSAIIFLIGASVLWGQIFR